MSEPIYDLFFVIGDVTFKAVGPGVTKQVAEDEAQHLAGAPSLVAEVVRVGHTKTIVLSIPARNNNWYAFYRERGEKAE